MEFLNIVEQVLDDVVRYIYCIIQAHTYTWALAYPRKMRHIHLCYSLFVCAKFPYLQEHFTTYSIALSIHPIRVCSEAGKL